MDRLKLGRLTLAIILSCVMCATASAATGQPFGTLVFEVGNKYSYNKSSHRLLIVNKNANGRTTFQTCGGPLGSSAGCSSLGSPEGYNDAEMEQVQKQLNKRSRLYTIFVGTPVGVCGALLGGVAAPALVLGAGFGIAEAATFVSEGMGGLMVAIGAGYLSLMISPFAAMFGALGGAEYTVKSTNHFFNARDEVYAPNTAIGSTRYLNETESGMKKIIVGEIRDIENVLEYRGDRQQNLFPDYEPNANHRIGFLEVNGDPTIVFRKLELALGSIRQ